MDEEDREDEVGGAVLVEEDAEEEVWGDEGWWRWCRGWW